MTAPNWPDIKDMGRMELEDHARSLRETCKAQDEAAQKVQRWSLDFGIQMKRMREALKSAQWGADDWCIGCDSMPDEGHKENCPIGLALSTPQIDAEKTMVQELRKAKAKAFDEGAQAQMTAGYNGDGDIAKNPYEVQASD